MNQNHVNKTCRLCLKLCNDVGDIIDEISESNLNSLLLYPNLVISDEPMICETCSENLKHCLSFKAKCVYTEDRIVALNCGTDDEKIDLRQVSKSEINKNLSSGPDNQNICRLCLEVAKSGAYTSLRTGYTEDMDLTVMLEKYFPEMDLQATHEPIICTLCHQSLQRHLSFINSCLKTEEILVEYCKVEGTNSKGQVDLRTVAQFLSKNMLKSKNSLSAIKTEEIYSENNRKHVETIVEVKMEKVVEVKQELQIRENGSNDLEQAECEGRPEAAFVVKQTFSCDTCGYRAKRRYDLKQHVLSHVSMFEATMYTCPTCGFETKYKNYLRKHALVHKSDDEVATKLCTLCDYRTRHMSNLRKHMVIHKSAAEVTMHRCAECGFATRYKNNLDKHSVIHRSGAEVRTYMCETCAFETKHKNSLQKHLLTHRSEEEAAVNRCEVCDYRTKRKDVLQQHMLRHMTVDEVTSYGCGECDYKAKRKDCLRRHELTHRSNDEVSTFKCGMCSFETKYKKNLRKHAQTHKGGS